MGNACVLWSTLVMGHHAVTRRWLVMGVRVRSRRRSVLRAKIPIGSCSGGVPLRWKFAWRRRTGEFKSWDATSATRPLSENFWMPLL